MPYPILPPLRERKRKRKPRGRPGGSGTLKSRDLQTQGWLYNIPGPYKALANDVRYYNWVAPMNPGNFKDPTSWLYVCIKHRCWNGVWKSGSTVSSNSFTKAGCLSRGGSWEGPTMNTEETYRNGVYNTALSRLNEKVRGGVDLGLNLVEAGQTGRMLASLANFRHFVSGIRRGDINPFGGSSRDIANGWLQFQYGWRPLLSDIFKALDEGNRIVLNAVERVKASAHQPLSGSVKTEIVHGIPGCSVNHTTKGKMACTIHMKYSVNQGFDLARWSSLNPVSLAWEVIPYSFVVDWFMDVSSFLRNLETACLYNAAFMGGYVSELFVDETQCYLPYKERIVGTTRDELFNVMGSYRKVWFNRSVLTSYPLPRRPSFEVKLGWQRLVSAAALVRQVFK